MSQTVQAAMLGLVGGAIPEVLRAIAALRAGRTPSRGELVASLLAACLGIGVLFFDTKQDSPLQIAVLGAAFPQIFAGMVAAAGSPAPPFRGEATSQRSVWDYIGWRL